MICINNNINLNKEIKMMALTELQELQQNIINCINKRPKRLATSEEIQNRLTVLRKYLVITQNKINNWGV